MNKPTKEQIQWFWEQCGFTILPYRADSYGKINDACWLFPGYRHQLDQGVAWSFDLPPIDLNNLFKYAPDIIVGIYFRYYPGGCECELTYITEAGFDTEKSWVKNETGDEKKSRELSALALFWAIYRAFGGE